MGSCPNICRVRTWAEPEGDDSNVAEDGSWGDDGDIQFRNQHAVIQLCKSHQIMAMVKDLQEEAH